MTTPTADGGDRLDHRFDHRPTASDRFTGAAR
jgi:hypothetical protein